jgi:phage major head subunit gpT-like protein
MSGVITTSHFGKALWPGINAWYGKAYEDYPVEYTDLFDTFQSSKAFEEDVMVSSFGLAPVKEEGAAIQYDSEQQGFISRYSHVTYALGFIITREMFDDDQYDIVGQRRAQALARSMRQTKETVAANVYNRAFNSSYTGGDGKELCATDHPNVAGGTWANELTTPADLSEASLEQAIIDMMAWTDDRGLLIAAMPEKLIIPPELVFEAERILESPLRVGTADNDANALKNLGKFRGGVTVNHYLTDADAWFIRTNVSNGMKHFERKADSFAEDNDFDTDNAKFKASARYSFGWSDPRGIFGSPGA